MKKSWKSWVTQEIKLPWRKVTNRERRTDRRIELDGQSGQTSGWEYDQLAVNILRVCDWSGAFLQHESDSGGVPQYRPPSGPDSRMARVHSMSKVVCGMRIRRTSGSSMLEELYLKRLETGSASPSAKTTFYRRFTSRSLRAEMMDTLVHDLRSAGAARNCHRCRAVAARDTLSSETVDAGQGVLHPLRERRTGKPGWIEDFVISEARLNDWVVIEVLEDCPDPWIGTKPTMPQEATDGTKGSRMVRSFEMAIVTETTWSRR